jgi:Flp pilus assembly protein TadG
MNEAGKRSERERGASLVETALALLLLLLLLAGVIDVGRAFGSYEIITNAAREGARYGARFSWHEAGIRSAVTAEVADTGVPPAALGISIAGLSAPAGETIRVTVSYDFATILGNIVGAPSFSLSSSAAMVILFGPGG